MVIELQGVSKRLGSRKVTAVQDFNLAVERGELLTLLGPSGCGKTTALRLIAGFEQPDIGRIFLNGELVAGDGRFVPPEKRKVGIVFQEFALFPHLTVEKNVAFGLRNKGKEKTEERVQEMLKLTGLQDLRNQYPFELSGGQQQRVAIARALSPSPLVVLLDEPFGSLDQDLRSRMRTDLKEILKETEVTVVFVTHDQEEAFLMADRIAVMESGAIQQTGSPLEIYRRPRNRFVAEFVGHADLIAGRLATGLISTEIGDFALPGKVAAKEGEQVSIMLRPDDNDILPAEFGTATIQSIEFKGDAMLYCIKLQSGQLIHSLQSPAFLLPIGTTVLVMSNPKQLVVLRGNESSICYKHS